MSHWRRSAGGTTTYATNAIARVDLQGMRALGKHRKGPFIPCTANTTVTQANTGSIYTAGGIVGNVVFTLPKKAPGLWYTFMNVGANNMTITSDAVNTMIVDAAAAADATADSVAFSTPSEKKGAVCEVICDGTSWIASVPCKHTATVA